MKAKKQKDVGIQDIKDIFKLLGISGILFFPEDGSISLFSDEQGRNKVLDHARLEMMADDIVRNQQAEMWAVKYMNMSKLSNNTKKEISYIG